MTAPGGHLVRALVAVGTLSCFLAAFDGGSAALGDSSASPAPTTTLPVAIDIPGSAAGGAFAALGPVRRVDVLPVVPGRVAPKLLADGTMPARSLRVAYRQFGSGPDLLLITGEHGSLTSWDPQVLVALGAYYRVTVFDLPGVGYSEPSRGTETVPRLADLTAGLIWSLGLSQPTVVGWGLGGEIAMALVERHAGLVWRLVLADSTAGGPKSYRPAAAVSALFASGWATTVELSSLFFPASARLTRSRWLADVGQVNPDDITAPAIEAEGSLVAQTDRASAVAHDLATIGIPTLIFAGSADVVVPVANSRELSRAIAHSRLIIFSGAGYASIFQYSSEFVSELTLFTNS